MEDRELLQNYVTRRSQDAFRELVNRHLPMVYATAKRIVQDGHLAEEVAQNVFATFADKAASLKPSQVIGGWLYNTTRNLAMHAVRSEQRRRQREEQAVAMQSLIPEADQDTILDALEPAMAELDDAERDTLVLRFMENRSLREVGAELGLSEDAARMRVNRALEKLRLVFQRQGLSVTASMVGAALVSTNTVAVPSGLAATVMTTTLGATIAAGTIKTAAITTMNWINGKSIAAIAGASLLAGTGAYVAQQKTITGLQEEVNSLKAQQISAEAERDTAMKTAQAEAAELEQLRKNNAELLRLRNEIAQTRRQRDAEAALAAKRVAARDSVAVNDQREPRPFPPGTYISRDNLVFGGYETPEAALQSVTFGLIHGTYDLVTEGSGPDIRADEAKQAAARENFEKAQQKISPLFKGFQIVARKVLAEDRVELKIRYDTDPIPGSNGGPEEYMIQQMVRIENEWRMTGSTKSHRPGWETDGQVITYAQ